MHLGQRISLHGSKGTIRYIGEVHGTSGTWLGVEWDNPERGKHSGAKDGKHYFTCRVPGTGSFIRQSPAISFGQSFLRTLISKYVEVPHSNSQKETVILGSSNGAIEVEAVGLDKVRGKLARLEGLREISLDDEDVAYADAPGEIRKTCPNVRSLDLSNSLLPAWDQIGLITSELLYLRELSLNRNRFSELSVTAELGQAFLALEEVQLNEAMMSWQEVTLLISIMPNLRVLEVGYNNMERLGGTTIDLDEVPLASLRLLNLDENRLDDWSDVMRSVLPLKTLDRLILTANKLERIPRPPALDNTIPNIKYLGIQDNLLSEWQDVDVLNVWLPNMKTLNLNGNPLLSRSPDFRQQAIARLPNLELLNGTTVSIKERTDSEIYCISQMARNAQIPPDGREVRFPRWKELCEKHGAPEEMKRSSTKGHDTLADRLISIRVYHAEAAEPDTHENTQTQVAPSSVRPFIAQLPPPSTLRVLPTMPIRLLRSKLSKSLLPSSDHSILKSRTRKAPNIKATWIVMGDDGMRKIDLDEEDRNRDLAWWGIEDGSVILVFTNHSDSGQDQAYSNDDRDSQTSIKRK